MRRKIVNPHNPEISKCFGCSTNNPIGLKLEFEEVDDYLVAKWDPGEYYQGYVNVLHGGIIATLLDELGAWCVNVKIGTAGVTSQLNISYIKPVFISRGTVKIKTRIVNTEDKNVFLEGELYDGQNNVCAKAETIYYAYPEELARRKFGFPGKEAFFEKT